MHGQKLKVVCHTVPGNHGFSPSLENVTALPTSGCEAISTESSQATLNITNSLRQQKFRIKKCCHHLGDQTKPGGFSLWQAFRCYMNWMFWACSAQIAFQASYSGMRKLILWEDAWPYLYSHTHGYSLLLIFVTPAISFISVTLWWFQIRFKALPVIQVLVSLKAEQRDLKFVFVIVVFPVKTIIWKHPALSLTSTIFCFNSKKLNNLNKLSENVFLPFLLAIHLWLPNYSLICISDSMSNKTLKCHFMVVSRNDSIYYATLYPCTYPDSKIKYLATPNAVPYFS